MDAGQKVPSRDAKLRLARGTYQNSQINGFKSTGSNQARGQLSECSMAPAAYRPP